MVIIFQKKKLSKPFASYQRTAKLVLRQKDSEPIRYDKRVE